MAGPAEAHVLNGGPKPVLGAAIVTAILLVSVTILLAFPYRGPAPSWFALAIVFGVVFAVVYARAKYEQRRKRQ